MEKRTRKIQEIQPIEPIKAQVQETSTKPKWIVVSGGFTGLNRVSYVKGDTFEANDWEIPLAFRDIVKCINPEALKPKKASVEPTYFLQEVVPTAEEADEDDYVLSYNIINAKDKVISEKPLPKEQAEELLKKLNV